MVNGRIALAVLAFACGIAVGAVQTGAQNPDGLLTWDFTFDDGAVPVGDRVFRVYEGPPSLGVFLRVVNDTGVALSIDQAKLRGALRLQVSSGRLVPVAASWLPDIATLEGSELVASVDLQAPVRISPMSQARWRLTLQRTDEQPFLPGEYRVEMSIKDLAFATSASTGEPWQNRRPLTDRATLVLRVEPPASAREQLAMHIHHGRLAVLRGDGDASLTEFRRAVSLDPTDTEARFSLGGSLLMAGRYREAAAEFELVLAREQGEGRVFVIDSLAHARVGLGDEEEAARLLRTLGRPEETIARTLDDMRAALAARASR